MMVNIMIFFGGIESMNEKKFTYCLVFLIIMGMFLGVTGCANHSEEKVLAKDEKSPAGKIRIAKQFGIVYAPLMVAEKNDIFSKYGLEVEWKTLGSGGAVREALAAGEVDVAFMGIPPFMIGWDKGVKAKIATGFTVAPVSLVTYDPNIKSISDFTEKHKIAVPSPGSVQHILLSMALKNETGKPNLLDDNLVSLPHPDGAFAMDSKQDVIAHFTTPPYLFEEMSWDGYNVILDGFDVLGTDFNFNVGLVTEEYHDNNPNSYAAFVMGLNEAVDWVNQNKEETAKLLAKDFNIKEGKLLDYLNADKINFTTTPYGLMSFAEFMEEAGYISKIPEDLSDIAWENVLAQIGDRQDKPSVLEEMQWRR